MRRLQTSLRGVLSVVEGRRSNLLRERLPQPLRGFAMTWGVVYADHCQPNQTHTDFGCIPHEPLAFASNVYGIGLTLIGGVALLSIIYGAFLVLTSQGDPVKLQNGKSYIVYALIGLGLAVFGFVFYRVIAADIIKIPGFS